MRLPAKIPFALSATAVAIMVSMLAFPGGRGRASVHVPQRARAAPPGVSLPADRLTAQPPPGLPRPLPGAKLTVSASGRGVPLPRSFLGLSTEYWSIPGFAAHLPAFEHALSILHVPGDGPTVLRVGGNSADHFYWAARTQGSRFRSFTVGSHWLWSLRRLVTGAHLRVILDLNLAADAPAMAARWAHAVLGALPHSSVAGFEVGNEPDIYHREPSLRFAAVAHNQAPSLAGTQRYSSGSYDQSFAAYASALHAVAPRIPIAGPAVANPALDLPWVKHLIQAQPRSLDVVTGHRYPLAACLTPRSEAWPTVGRLLSNNASVGMAQSVTAAARLAHRAGLPLRLSELGTVTCGGLAGVSDTFATALWAPDALFSLIETGVDSVNLHIRANAPNAPFVLRGGLRARPLLYGLIAFKRMLGPRARLLDPHWHSPAGVNLRAWAVRTGETLRVMLIDKSRRGVNVRLVLPTRSPATVTTLLAPSARATAKVSLGGQTLAPDGRWRGSAAAAPLERSAGAYHTSLRGYSAALVTVRLPRHGAHPTARESKPR